MRPEPEWVVSQQRGSGRLYSRIALRDYRGVRFLIYQLLLRVVLALQVVMRWVVR